MPQQPFWLERGGPLVPTYGTGSAGSCTISLPNVAQRSTQSIVVDERLRALVEARHARHSPHHAAYSQVASNCTEEDSAGPCQHCLGVQAPGSVVSDHREWWLRRQGDLGMAMRRATIHSGRSSCPVHIVLCASVSVKPSGVWKSRGFGWIPHLLVPPGPEARSSTALSSFPPNTGWHDGGNEFFAARPRRPMDPGLSCYRPWLKGISRHRRRSILCIAQNAPISLRGGRTSSVGCW